ncbi:ATP-binding protein [Bdellovibrio sp. HCB337]|uniref:ATP-binding protein n=1 Tax=Bdellovibrio sp. HCB337 TaxID=3394358 RepID=UPI0039A66D7F
MEKSSLFHFLLSRFGAYFGVILLVASCFYYFRENTSKIDIYSLSLLEESKQRIDQATRASLQYVNTAKSKDLDEYNAQILLVSKKFNELNDLFKRYPSQHKKFAEVQKRSRAYFLSLNERIVQRQNGSQDRGLANKTEVSEVIAPMDEMIRDIRDNSSEPLNVFGFNLPMALWYFLGGVLLACFCILKGHSLQKRNLEDQKQDISELKIQSILLDGILNSISEALIVIDERGQFTRYNTAAQRIIGSKIKSISSDEDARDFGFFDITSLQQLGLMEMPFARALRGEPVDDLEILVHNELHPEGIYISISSRYLSDIDGSIRGALVVFRDISRRKATEQEWLRARESALETARKKSDFLAAMSHEIRTPMNGVIGMTTLLAETSLNEEQKDYVGTIKRSAGALLRLINDILDHSKIEAGKIQMQVRPFDLKFLCEDVLELFHPTTREKNIGLDVSFLGREEWNYIGDPERLRQILVNLIGNSVKFTETGYVKITVECLTTTRGKSELKISVMDTGPGMSEEESQLLFQKYFQTKTGMKYGGTGLGLSICHQLVELMGGKIGLHSKLGLGSTFWFTVELPETTAEQIPTQKEHSFAPIFKGRVLLAEDQPVNQRVAVTYLQKLGLEVDVANNGQVAVEKALAKSYDVIFMDCQMPIMTGYDATKKIRELQKGEKTPIVALTAEGTSGEKATCFSMGMDDFLTKPLELERLIEVLHKWLKTTAAVLDEGALLKLKNYVVNNKSLTQALIEDYFASAPGLRESIQSAFKEGNLEKIQESAHALKSSSATLGATALANICQNIEDIENIQDVEPLLKSMDDQFEKSLSELQKYLTKAAA